MMYMGRKKGLGELQLGKGYCLGRCTTYQHVRSLFTTGNTWEYICILTTGESDPVFFSPVLGLPSEGHSGHTKNQVLPKLFTEKRVKGEGTACHYATKKIR